MKFTKKLKVITFQVCFLFFLPTAHSTNLSDNTSINIENKRIASSEVIFIFRNDDPSALSDLEHEKKVMELFKAHQIPQTFGIIPHVARNKYDPQDHRYIKLTANSQIYNALKKWQKEGLTEIALHGLTHQYSSKRSSEFYGVSLEKQLKKIKIGKEYLEKWFDTQVVTFIPPDNSYDINTLKAASMAGMRVFSSGAYDIYLSRDEYLEKLYVFNITVRHYVPIKSLISLAKKVEGGRILIMFYYHSHYINNPNRFKNLENILKIVSSTKDVYAMTMAEATKKYPSFLKELTSGLYDNAYVQKFNEIEGGWILDSYRTIYRNWIRIFPGTEIPILSRIHAQLELSRYPFSCKIYDSIKVTAFSILIFLMICSSSAAFIIYLIISKIFKLIESTVLRLAFLPLFIIFFLSAFYALNNHHLTNFQKIGFLDILFLVFAASLILISISDNIRFFIFRKSSYGAMTE